MTKPINRKMAVAALLYRFLHYALGAGPSGACLRCAICNGTIAPKDDIQFDHIHADVFGGPHEYKNLRPLHAECHKKKTKADIQANAKIKRLRKGKVTKSRPMPFGNGSPFRRKMNGEIVKR